MNYNFEQFNVSIKNPTIEIDMTRIIDNTIDKLLTIPIVLISENARFGIELNSIIYVETWNDSDVEDLVKNRLNDFVVNN